MASQARRSTPATLAYFILGTLCPLAVHDVISADAIGRNLHKKLYPHLPCAAPNEWKRACLNITGSLGISTAASIDPMLTVPRELRSERFVNFLHRGISMSISGILSSSNQYQIGAASNSIQQQFQQLGQALQSGNLSSAQSDFATLQAAFSQPASTSGSATSTTSATTASPINQAFHQLASDLQSGNLSAAQKDYSTVQQDLQSAHGTLANSRFNQHHHHGGGVSTGPDTLLQDLSQVGQNLSSSNLPAAQQAYTTLQQQLQQFALVP